jgi:hypothetical protein
VTEQQLAATRLCFERLAEDRSRIGFRFRNGHEFLGWVGEVGESVALLIWAPSPFYAQATGTDEWAPPDAWVPFTEIELASLQFWDESARVWVDAFNA